MNWNAKVHKRRFMGTLSWVHFPPPLGVLIRFVRRLRRRAGRSSWRGHSGAGRGTWGHGNEKARTDGRTKRVCRTRVASSCISANQQPMACKISNFDHLAKNQLLQQHIHRPNEDMLSKNKFFSDALYQSFFDFHRHPSLTWLTKKQVTTNSGVWCRLHTEKNVLRNRRKNACVKKRPAQLYQKRQQKFTRIPVNCCCNNSTRLNSFEFVAETRIYSTSKTNSKKQE